MGPLVAGLSLGSPAFMHFRLQRKHDRVGERKGILMSFILRHVSCPSTLSYNLPILIVRLGIQGDVFVMDGIGVQKFYEWVPPPCIDTMPISHTHTLATLWLLYS